MRRRRLTALAAVAALTMAVPLAGAAQAITPPVIDPAAVPADGTPGPDEDMKKSFECPRTGVMPNSDLAAPPPPQAFMNLPEVWKAAGSRGDGVTVAMIDTGVSPSPRLPHLRGAGDYVEGGAEGGLFDCDSHGTIVAGIIGGAPAEGDGFVGVAPDVELVSIRQSSAAYTPEHPSLNGNSDDVRRAGTVNTLARAVVHAANTGARVINMSVVSCIPVLKPVDQTTLGAAIRYAAMDKDAVLVAASGNLVNSGCGSQNPDIDATNIADPRNWSGVVTISTPSWFSDYVLSVSATDAAGGPALDDRGKPNSLAGPWLGVGAPGLFVEGFNDKGELINATFDEREGVLKPMSGTSFSTAYVSGLAALVRAKYPRLPAAQVINRIKQTAHSPAGVIDNRIGYGVIDPVAALNYDVPLVPPARENLSRPLGPPPPPPPVDNRPMATAIIGTAGLALLLAAVFGITALVRKNGPRA
jgi:membrane-anchored mycosin MYCP